MAKTEYTKIMHERQAKAVAPKFEHYKDYIATEIINKYGRAYETPGAIRDNWFSTFRYSKEMADYVIEKTLRFLTDMSIDGIYDSQILLERLTNKISWLLAQYLYRVNVVLTKTKYKECKDKIFDTIFTNNTLIQKRIHEYNKTQQRVIAEIQLKANKKVNPETVVPETPVKKERRHIVLTPGQMARHNPESVNVKINVAYIPQSEYRMSKKAMRRRIREIQAEIIQIERKSNGKTYC